jgi:hypothetical protein
MSERSVNDISDTELLQRAVYSARARSRRRAARWVAVMECFALGSTYSKQLCERFGFDPDEVVSR